MKQQHITVASVIALAALTSGSALATPALTAQAASASMASNQSTLNEVFNHQNLKSTQGLLNDCAVGTAGQMCVAVNASGTDTHTLDAATGSVVVAFKPTEHFRFGAYLDQSHESQDRLVGFNLKKGNPGYGLFAQWSTGQEGSALHVRAAANVGNIFIETTRQGDENSEDGFGLSNVKSNAFQLDLIKDYALNNQWMISPYIGYRETRNNRLAYTELSSQEVTRPLTYRDLQQTVQTVSAGATLTFKVLTDTQLALSAGVENDVENHIDAYSATSNHIAGIEPLAGAGEKRKITTVGFSFKHSLSSSETIGFAVTQRNVKSAPEALISGAIQYSKSF